MNAKMKKRMIAVSGVIVIVLILVLAFVGGNTAATTMSIAEAAENPQAGQKVQVSGNVVQDSFSTSSLSRFTTLRATPPRSLRCATTAPPRPRSATT